MGETGWLRAKRRTVYLVAYYVGSLGETIDLPVTQRFKPCRMDIARVADVEFK